jgi:maleylacetoacetate isomerase
MSDPVLHDYWRSSAAYRVRIGLNLLGLSYRSQAVDLLAGDQRAAENIARNPQGLVPTLEIDGLILTQSLAILEYLDETRGLAGCRPPRQSAPGFGRLPML